MAPLALPPPLHYTIADLAHEWKCHPDRILMLADAGVIEVTTIKLGGVDVPAVAHQERERFEGAACPAAEVRPMNPTERKTLLNIIAALAYIAYSDDVLHPYTLTGKIEKEAATHGVPLEFGDDTLSDKLKAAFALMRARGCRIF